MSVQSVLEDFGETLVKDVQANLADKQAAKAAKHGTPFNRNSNLSNSVKFKISNKSGAILFELTMADYYDWVDRGRNAGNVSEDGQGKIKYWIKKKGLNPVKIISEMRLKAREKAGTQGIYKPRKKLTFEKASKALTYLVSRKLKNDGYRGNFFYSEIILDGRIDKLQEAIQKELNEEVEIIINAG